MFTANKGGLLLSLAVVVVSLHFLRGIRSSYFSSNLFVGTNPQLEDHTIGPVVYRFRTFRRVADGKSIRTVWNAGLERYSVPMLEEVRRKIF